MSARSTIRCLKCRIRELRAEITALDGTPPPVCCVPGLHSATADFVIGRLRCAVKSLEAVLAAVP